MKDEVSKKLDTYLTFIKSSKYNLFFVGAIAIMLFIIIFMILLIINYKNTSTAHNNPAISPSNTVINTSPSQSNMQITTPDPTQAAVIEDQTQLQITPRVAVPYTVSTITKYGDAWATMNITNQDVGSAEVIVHKVNGVWKTILGPGSYFSPDQLQTAGVPQSIIDSFTTQPSTSPLPIQSNSNDIQ